MLKVENKELVYPGKILAEGKYVPSEGTHKVDTKIVSSVVGFVNVFKKEIRVTSFQGVYDPVVGDVIVGIIEDIGHNFWFVDTNSPYNALLAASEVNKKNNYVEDLKDIFNVGEIVIGKIITKDYNKQIKISAKDKGLGKDDGYLIHISPKKVARIIGKRGSMISNLKKYTKSNFVVGKNGRILIKGGDITKAISIIKFIERNAHTSGLTNRVKEILSEDKEIAE